MKTEMTEWIKAAAFLMLNRGKHLEAFSESELDCPNFWTSAFVTFAGLSLKDLSCFCHFPSHPCFSPFSFSQMGRFEFKAGLGEKEFCTNCAPARTGRVGIVRVGVETQPSTPGPDPGGGGELSKFATSWQPALTNCRTSWQLVLTNCRTSWQPISTNSNPGPGPRVTTKLQQTLEP